MKKKIVITCLMMLLMMMMAFSSYAAEENLGGDVFQAISEEEPTVMLISAWENLEDTAMDDWAGVPTLWGEKAIKVQLDGEIVDFTDAEGNKVEPKIIQNRTMVPMRKIFEILDAEVNWNPETRTVEATTDNKVITLTIDSNVAKTKDLETNEEKEITLDAAPVLLENRTMVPVRFIVESLEKEVGWDAAEKTVVIIDFEKVTKELEENVPNLKKIFDLNLEPMTSFKTTSEVEAKYLYKDKEDKENNQEVKLNGTIEVNLNQKQDFEMIIDLKLTGKGDMYESLKDYQTIKFGIVIVDGVVYSMTEKDGKEVWRQMDQAFDKETFLKILEMQNQTTSCEEFVESLKEALGELNVNSYEYLQLAIRMTEYMYGDDQIKITGTKSKPVVKVNWDLKKVLAGIDSSFAELLSDGNMELSMIEKIENNLVKDTKVEVKAYLESPETKESIEANFTIDMTLNSVNQNFRIKVPEVKK